ncbi:D-alanyl-D-alanine carboxypeptidase family protein [Butyrivibrio sp. X503]|uniref:M15 family metallopeptidase n=1 Tax=Butyrivibrio sp. X503 TaxID=2364878 RepID=UPI000EA9FCCC|nr:M15 family metallopeptidase [Butyrivibrio sp. X503]RKM57276.1 D-alanyl-D-alanine carboxypeptidase family protein [Butyrivibrio sp. X503]
MNASNLQMKLTFKNKVISTVSKFNRKHKALSFLGIAYALLAITVYNILFCFYRNAKRHICLACILLFFVFSSSFSYPAMSLNISFASDMSIEDYTAEDSQDLSETEVAESDAELAVVNDVDAALIEEAMDSVNPDVAEAEHTDPEKQASLSEILENTAENASFETISDNEVRSDDAAEDSSQFETEEEKSFDSSEWNIILVNKQHPIPEDYEFPLGVISGSMRCDERIISPLLDMLRAASADGVSLIICSPYRDLDRQTMLFDNKIDRYMTGGMSYMEAYNLASQAVTVPGSSEHQIGLAIDIISDSYSNLDEGFGNTSAGKWLHDNSYKYGFILRYPEGKEKITSIEYEPWHFRYVGVDAATIIYENDICLEEFWNTYVK